MWTFQLPNATAALGELRIGSGKLQYVARHNPFLSALSTEGCYTLQEAATKYHNERKRAAVCSMLCVCLQWGVERLFVCWLLHKRVHSRLKTNGDIPHSWLVYQTRSAHYNNKGWHICYRRLHAALDTLYIGIKNEFLSTRGMEKTARRKFGEKTIFSVRCARCIRR